MYAFCINISEICMYSLARMYTINRLSHSKALPSPKQTAYLSNLIITEQVHEMIGTVYY